MRKTTERTYHMLIVEDDPDIRMGLREYFDMEGYEVETAEDGEVALEAMKTTEACDIVLLDIMLPKKDGFEVLSEAQELGFSAPVLVLTAKGEQESKLKGFGLGADDYVTKPFDTAELTARVEAVLSRSKSALPDTGDVYSFGDLTVNFPDQTVSRENDEIELTDLEFEILKYFIKHRGRTVSREKLLRDVWGISGDITTRTIDRHVASLRKKIEPMPDDPTYLETVYGIGYKFTE